MLSVSGVLRDAARLYQALFWRTVVTTGLVFAVVCLVETVGPWPVVLLSFVGTAVVQGALVEAVEQERQHRDGGVLRAAWNRAGALLGVALLTGIGVGVGLFLLVVPGLILFTRWSLAVPAVMLEGRSPRDAMRRSHELVKGHGWQVFAIFLTVTAGTFGTSFLLERLLAGPLGLWAALTLAATLTTPFAAHALNVVYYRIVGIDSTGWRSTGRQKTA
jgi:Membrane domain of glycerophosphoryl diester phosphodiesterase